MQTLRVLEQGHALCNRKLYPTQKEASSCCQVLIKTEQLTRYIKRRCTQHYPS